MDNLDTFAAYVAGVADSDGSMSLIRRTAQTTRNRYHYRPNFQLMWLNKPSALKVMQDIQKLYGGYIYEVTRKTGYKTDQVSYLKLMIEGQRMYKFLSDISPYLQLKREQALLLLEFIRKRTDSGRSNNMRGSTPKGDEEWEEERVLHVKIRALNSKNGKSHG